MPGLTSDPTLGTGSTIGRYFGVVSTVPSVLLAAWIYLLVASGAFTGPPALGSLRANNPVAHPGYLAAGVGLALVLALALHPVQFALVQLMEGYWGTGRVTRGIRRYLVLRQLERRLDASEERRTAEIGIADMSRASAGDITSLLGPTALRENPASASAAIAAQVMADSAKYVEGRFPSNPAHTMPTRLGNVLRRHEQIAGAAVGLPVLSWANHIGMSADPRHNEYAGDQRTQMDLSVRLAASMLVASVLTFALTWPYGPAVLLAFPPLAVAWLSYRGAVVLAESYGRSLHAWVDLNRFRLYEQLQLAPVASARTERERNTKLVPMRLGQDTFDVPLRLPGAAAPCPAAHTRLTAVAASVGTVAGLGLSPMVRRLAHTVRERIVDDATSS